MLKVQIVSSFLQESFFRASHNTVGKQNALLKRAHPQVPCNTQPESYSSLLCSPVEIYACPLRSMLCPKASDMKNETNKTNFHRGHNVENIASFPLLNQTIEPASPINPPPPPLWHRGTHVTNVYWRPTLCQAFYSAVACIY